RSRPPPGPPPRRCSNCGLLGALPSFIGSETPSGKGGDLTEKVVRRRRLGVSVLLCIGMVAVPFLCLGGVSAPATRHQVVAAGPRVADVASRHFDAAASRSALRAAADAAATVSLVDAPSPPTTAPTSTAPPLRVAAVRA